MTYLFSNEKGASEITAFGEPVAITLTPILQVDGIYGVLARELEGYSAGSGTYGAANSVMTVSSGTSVGSYGVLRSRRLLRYRSGQGALSRFTAGFTTPSANTTQRAGFFSQEQALNIGYNGTNFGVLRQNGGKAVIYRLGLTVAAGGTETANVTLNGVSKNITLTVANTVNNSAVIASNSFPGWLTEQEDSTVVFLSASVGPMAGAFSYTSTGSSAGTMTQIQAGVNHTDTWTYQQNWNIDRLDGSGPSGAVLDPSKLNIYQINFRWLGAGEIRYAIENPINGDMVFFHHEHYSNRHTVPHLDKPSFKIGYIAANVSGNTSANVSTYGSSIMGAIEGTLETTTYTTAISSGTKTSLTGGSLHNLITVKNRLVYKDKINLRELTLKTISVSYQGQDPLELILVLNPTSFSTVHSYNIVAPDSNALYSTTAGTYTAGSEHFLAAFAVTGSQTFDISSAHLIVPGDNIVSVIARSGQAIQSIIAALTWTEI